MLFRRIYIVLMAAMLSLLTFAQTPVTRDYIDASIAMKGQAAIWVKYPGNNLFEQINRNLSVSNVSDGMVEIVLSPADTSYFYSLALTIYTLEEPAPKSPLSAITMSEAMNWDIYPTYQQYDSIMRYFAESYPDICRIDTIGFTYMERAVLALKISDNVRIDEPEPRVFFTSSMHGDELAGFVLLLRLANHLLENYHLPGIARELVDSLEIWINPLANPDGTYTSPDRPGSRDTILFPTRVNSIGTDLNRSFPGPLRDQDFDDETNNFISFQAKNRFTLSVNLHSGEEVVNYPWDTWQRKHPDDEWFATVSRAWADTVHSISGPGYMNGFDNGIVRGYLWYDIRGGRQDYITWAQNGREITVEIDKTKLTPGSRLPNLWKYNYRSMLRYAENAMFGVHGMVTDINTGKPLEATVTLSNHDTDGSHIVSDSATGYFVRLISPGSWDIILSADGYKPETVGVIVDERKQTRLSVALEPLEKVPPGGEGRNLILYPVPASGDLNILLSGGHEGEGELTIISLHGKIVMQSVHYFASGEPVTEEISRLASGVYICRVMLQDQGKSFSSLFVIR